MIVKQRTSACVERIRQTDHWKSSCVCFWRNLKPFNTLCSSSCTFCLSIQFFTFLLCSCVTWYTFFSVCIMINQITFVKHLLFQKLFPLAQKSNFDHINTFRIFANSNWCLMLSLISPASYRKMILSRDKNVPPNQLCFLLLCPDDC